MKEAMVTQRNIKTKARKTANTAALCTNHTDVWCKGETAKGVDDLITLREYAKL